MHLEGLHCDFKLKFEILVKKGCQNCDSVKATQSCTIFFSFSHNKTIGLMFPFICNSTWKSFSLFQFNLFLIYYFNAHVVSKIIDAKTLLFRSCIYCNWFLNINKGLCHFLQVHDIAFYHSFPGQNSYSQTIVLRFWYSFNMLHLRGNRRNMILILQFFCTLKTMLTFCCAQSRSVWLTCVCKVLFWCFIIFLYIRYFSLVIMTFVFSN